MKTYDHKGKPLMTREEAEAAKVLLWKRSGEKLIRLYLGSAMWMSAVYYRWHNQQRNNF